MAENEQSDLPVTAGDETGGEGETPKVPKWPVSADYTGPWAEEDPDNYWTNWSDRCIDLVLGDWNLSLQDIQDRIFLRAREDGVGSVSFGGQVSSKYLNFMGFSKVFPVPYPGGDHYEVAPVKAEDGRYYQTWVERIPSEEELRQNYENARQTALNTIRDIRRRYQTNGIAVNFGGEQGVLHVQTRTEDRLNLLELENEAKDLVAAGQAETILVLRTGENINVEIMAGDYVKLSRAVAEKNRQVMAWGWNHSDAVRVAEFPTPLPEVPGTIEGIEEIDLTA